MPFADCLRAGDWVRGKRTNAYRQTWQVLYLDGGGLNAWIYSICFHSVRPEQKGRKKMWIKEIRCMNCHNIGATYLISYFRVQLCMHHSVCIDISRSLLDGCDENALRA